MIFDLDKYIKQIKKIQPAQSGFVYKRGTWKNLKSNHKALFKDYENKMITRPDVIKAYKDYFNGKGDCLKPFLMTMIWGFADTGYGTYRTNSYVTDAANLKLVKAGVDAVKINDLKSAFKHLKSIKGLGISYLSKVLYFATKGAGIKEYALIFDIRVARSLVQLSVPAFMMNLVSIFPSNKFEDYQKYNDLLHKLAKQYKVEADAIELFLFQQKF